MLLPEEKEIGFWAFYFMTHELTGGSWGNGIQGILRRTEYMRKG